MAKKANAQNIDDVQRIRQALEKKGWTQQKLSEMSGVTPQQISKCFRNNRFPAPSRDRIFATLGINIIYSDVAKATVNALPSFVGFVEYKGETTKLNDVTDLLKLSSEIQNDIAPSEVKTNGKDLMSNIVQTNVPKAFKFAEQFDTSELRRFLKEDSNIPLIVVSIGGSKAAGVYAKTLYSMYDGLATSVTFYMLNALSDAVIANSKVLFVSGGRDIDICFAVDRVLKLTDRVAILSHRSHEYATERIRAVNPKNVFEHDAKLFNEEFVSSVPMFLNCSILYKAFTNNNDFIEKLGADKISMRTSDNYTFETNYENLKYSCPKLGNIRTFHVLHGVASETVAADMKSKLTESGMAATIVSDYRTFCHGEFIFASNHVENPNNVVIPSDTAIVLLVTPREYQIVNEIRTKALAAQMPIIIIKSDIEDEALATLDLLIKENVLICDIGESRGVNPTSPQNYASIDKRKPRSEVKFEKDFASRGCLRASWDGSVVDCVSQDEEESIVEYKEIDRSKDKYVEVIPKVNTTLALREARKIFREEEQRSRKLEKVYKKNSPLKVEDVKFVEDGSFRMEDYDTQRLRTWSFSKTTDERNGISLDVGNMSNTYGYDFDGRHFFNSEAMYQCAIFKNTPEAIKVQELVAKDSNGLTLKRTYVRNEKYKDVRRNDFEEVVDENGGQRKRPMWCFEWMKFCILLKARQNKSYRASLKAMPKNTVVIEKTPRKDDLMWGCWNEELESARKVVLDAYSDASNVEQRKQIYRVNNIGVWHGMNFMGKCLTILKICLDNNTEITLDTELLNDARINWFGKNLYFSYVDGKLVVEKVTYNDADEITEREAIDISAYEEDDEPTSPTDGGDEPLKEDDTPTEPKRRGRPKGSKNKATSAAQEPPITSGIPSDIVNMKTSATKVETVKEKKEKAKKEKFEAKAESPIFKNAIFDLDGTLLDTDVMDSYKNERTRIGKEKGKGSEEYKAATANMIAHVGDCTMYEGIAEVFDFVRDNDIYAAMATGANAPRMNATVDYFNIPIPKALCIAKQRFGGVTGKSTMIGIAKERMHIDNAIMFGNEADDIKAANKQDIESVACHWGVADEKEWKKILKANPTYIAETPSDIIPMLYRDYKKPITEDITEKEVKPNKGNKPKKEKKPKAVSAKVAVIERDLPPTLTEDGKYRFMGVGRIVLDVIRIRQYEGESYRGNNTIKTLCQEVGGNAGNVCCDISAFSRGKILSYPIAKLGISKVAKYIKADFERFGCDTSYVSTDNPNDKTYMFGWTLNFNVNGVATKPSGTNWNVMGAFIRRPEESWMGTMDGEAANFVNNMEFTPHIFFYNNSSPSHKVLANAFHNRGALTYFESTKAKDDDKCKAALSYVECADIVKFSREDVPNAEYFEPYCTDKLLIQSMDKDGIRFNLKGQGWVKLDAIYREDAVDPLGCGDATTAAFLNALVNHNCLSLDSMTEDIIKECLAEAQQYASETACHYTPKGMFYEQEGWNIPKSTLTEELVADRKVVKNVALSNIPLKDIRIYDKDKCLAYNSQFEILNGVETKYDKKGQCSVLSNFYSCEIHYNGMTFISAEQMYHYLKFKGNGAIQQAIMACKTGVDVMNTCKGVKPNEVYHEQTRWKNMTLAIESKFLCCKEFRDKVIATNDIDLVEVQTKKVDVHGAASSGDMVAKKGWDGVDVSDKYIGMSGCGRIMMAIREKFRGWSEEDILAYKQPTDLDEWWNSSPTYMQQLDLMGKFPTKGIIGSCIGDIVGRPYELHDSRTKDFNFPYKTDKMQFSDDTILTLAIADWLMSTDRTADSLRPIMLKYAKEYKAEPIWGSNFKQWIDADGIIDRKGIASNGAVMRVAPIAWVAKSLDEALSLAEIQARLTHDSDEAVRGAQSVVACAYMVMHGKSKEEIKKYVTETFGYNLNRSVNSIRKDYKFEILCDKCVPESIICWLESDSYEEAIRNCISLGADADTMASIVGAICGATPNMYPTQLMSKMCYSYLTVDQKKIIDKFDELYVDNPYEEGKQMNPNLLKTKEYTVDWAKKLIDNGENINFFLFYSHQQKGDKVDKSCLSQWFMRDFEVEGVKYNCMEQYMMASKARLFGDDEMLGKIMESSSQKDIKVYGRKVKNFDADVWEKNAFDIVVKGNTAKFSQNDDLKQFILGTGNDILVEASPYDKIWGIGMAESEEGSKDPSSWKGTNLLGFALTKVRNSIKENL